MVVICPCVGPNVASCPGGLLPPPFVHWVWATTPDVVRKTWVGALPNPAILPLVVRVAVVPEIALLIVGVPIKCALPANASVAVVDASIAAVNMASVVVGKFINCRLRQRFL